jgi:hypothetical protein
MPIASVSTSTGPSAAAGSSTSLTSAEPAFPGTTVNAFNGLSAPSSSSR